MDRCTLCFSHTHTYTHSSSAVRRKILVNSAHTFGRVQVKFHCCLNQGWWAWNTTTTHPPRSAQSIPQPCTTQASAHRLGGETPSYSASIYNRIRQSGACDGLAAPTQPPPGASPARRCAAHRPPGRCEGTANTHARAYTHTLV